MKEIYKFSVFCLTVLLYSNSCTTFDHKNPYPNMEIVQYGASHAYAFPNKSSTKLIINFEGSGWYSVLGLKNEKEWEATHIGAQLLQVLGNNYTFLIPEKFSRQPGMDYENNMEEREIYTIENLVSCYMESINGYLNDHEFTSIVLIGSSEGACILPLIYNNLDPVDKSKVSVMVSFGFGGLSVYESYTILRNRIRAPETQEWQEIYSYLNDTNILQEYDKVYTHFLDIFEPGKELYPDSFDELYYGFTYRWFNSIKDIRPFDYYKDINIPILFIHGFMDHTIPVESMYYLAENCKEKPFKYWVYPWMHGPAERNEVIKFRNDIAGWIIETDK